MLADYYIYMVYDYPNAEKQARRGKQAPTDGNLLNVNDRGGVQFDKVLHRLYVFGSDYSLILISTPAGRCTVSNNLALGV